MPVKRALTFLLVLSALVLSANLAGLMASEPAIKCTDIAGCKGEASCGAGASSISGCDAVCIGGGGISCEVKAD